MNNGGMSIRDIFENLDFSVCETLVNTNLLSHIAVCKAVLPNLIKQKSGTVVNILSAAGIIGLPVRTMYSATKFGLSGFGKALRSEVKQFGVNVLNIYPGYVQTNISKNAVTGQGDSFGKLDSNIAKGMTVEQCVDQILKAITLKRTEMIIGGLDVQLLPYVAPLEPLIAIISDFLYKKQI